jgi:hypothetical protein
MLAGPTTSPEVLFAQAATRLAGPGGLPLSPPVLSVAGERPLLKHVPGPTLGERLEGHAGVSSWLLSVTGSTLALLHREPCPVDRRAGPKLPPSPVRGEIRLRGDGELLERLQDVYTAATRGSTWCHGDARPDTINIGGGWPQFVDWQCSGTGAPELDLGVLLGAVIAERIAATMVHRPTGARLRESLAQTRQACRNDARSVLTGYRAQPGAFVEDGLLSAVIGASLLARASTHRAAMADDPGADVMYQIGSGLVLDPAHWPVLATPTARAEKVCDVAFA